MCVYVYTAVQHNTVYFVKLTNVLEDGVVYDYRGQCYLVILMLLIIAIQMDHVIIVVYLNYQRWLNLYKITQVKIGFLSISSFFASFCVISFGIRLIDA